MKKIIISLLTLSFVLSLSAQVKDVDAEASMNRSGDYMVVDMDLNLEDMDVRSNRAALLTPWIVSPTDSVELNSVGIYGRQRRIYYLRNGNGAISGEDEMVFRARKRPDTLLYNNVVPYESWMDGAILKLHRNDYGCCHNIVHHSEDVFDTYVAPYYPEMIYVQPAADTVKIRYIDGSAFVDFPVSETVIYPEYRNNTVELGKINSSIDEVRQDPDVEIISISLKGYASPESPYSNNTRLAAGRTEAIKEYILQLYDFKRESIFTDSEPEDWAGLRRYVEASNLEHKAEILARIDGDEEPDAKEARIRRDFRKDYDHLLKFCYPALRHTDYKIEYRVVTYSDVEIIRQIMEKEPQKLSQNEFYLLAKTYEPGSPEFNKVFETAVLMFPNDPIANLNAAGSAMNRNDLESAKRYLEKAGDSAETSYARGVWHFLKGENMTALAYLNDALERGIEKSKATIERIEMVKTTNKSY